MVPDVTSLKSSPLRFARRFLPCSLVAILCGCFFFEPIGQPTLDTAWSPLCDLPESVQDLDGAHACLRRGNTDALEPTELQGGWTGAFCIAADVAMGLLPFHDQCLGDFDVTLEPSSSPSLVGEGSCAFEGGGLFPLKPFLPDIYGGEFEGEWWQSEEDVHTMSTETEVGIVEVAWALTVCDEMLIGSASGFTSLLYETDLLEIDYDALFVAVPGSVTSR